MSDFGNRPRLELHGLGDFRAILEEDECGAAYAYLLHGTDIVGDVWLYNVAPSPAEAPWTSRTAKPPFLNPQSMSKAEAERQTLDTVTRVEAKWDAGGTVELFFDGRREARLWPGAKPGQSFMAAAKGPLASPLDAP